MNISQIFEKQTKSPKTALVYYGKKFSYEELGKFARLFASIFMRLGVKRDDRVALMMSNVPQFVFAYYGAILAGAIVTPINLLSLPRSYNVRDKTIRIPEEIKAQIRETTPSVIVAFDFYFPLLEELREEIEAQNTKVILTAPHEYMPPLLKRFAPIKLRQEGRWIKIKDRPPWIYDLNNFLDEEKGRLQPFSKFPGMKTDENDIAQLPYTGGTTGTPKGVMLTHKNLLCNIEQINEHLKGFLNHGEEVVLGALPFFHMYGMTAVMQITLLKQMGALVLVSDTQDIKRWVDWIEEYKITLIPSVPRLFERLSEHPELLKKKTFGSVGMFVNGAGALSLKIRGFFEEMSGAKIIEGYGLSETSPVVSICAPNDFREGSIGKPVPGTEVRIADLENGSDLERGQEGEIVVRGPQVMLGYWNKPEETARVLRDGWLYTGDIGHIDEDGFLYITDRIKDLVKINGESVFPAKVEAALSKHPEIKEAAVVGIVDDMGEKLLAYIVAENPYCDRKLLTQRISDWAKQNLSSPEIPRDIRFVESLEEFKNQLGKVLKRKILEALKPR